MFDCLSLVEILLDPSGEGGDFSTIVTTGGHLASLGSGMRPFFNMSEKLGGDFWGIFPPFVIVLAFALVTTFAASGGG